MLQIMACSENTTMMVVAGLLLGSELLDVEVEVVACPRQLGLHY